MVGGDTQRFCEPHPLPREHLVQRLMGRVDREPRVAGSKLIRPPAMTVSGAGVRAKRPDAVHHGIHAGKDFLHVIVFDGGRIEPQVLASAFHRGFRL